MMVKKIMIVTALAAFSALWAVSQSLPQFSSDDFDGWIYNNPGISLSSSSIGGGKIVLYVASNGLALSLVSPVFPCAGMDSISCQVTWFTRNFAVSGFDLSRTALTLAIDDEEGLPLDSVTVEPFAVGVSTHHLSFTIAVPHGLTAARMRFVAWKANVTSSGAVRAATFTAVSASPQGPVQPGDVDGDGKVNISDVTTLIDCLLSSSSPVNGDADVDGNGTVNISDVTTLIDMLLTVT